MLFAKIPSSAEAFRGGSTKCPSTLVESGDKLMLIYDDAPVYFNNLDEYAQFVASLRAKGIDCPVAVLERSNKGTVGVTGDASRENGVYNKGLFPGFDPYGMSVGRRTKLDEIHDSTAKSGISDNPMDPNWGGVEYTQSQVKSGKYEEREVSKQAQSNPKVQFFPDIKRDPQSDHSNRQ
jgi:hypothetical protein